MKKQFHCLLLLLLVAGMSALGDVPGLSPRDGVSLNLGPIGAYGRLMKEAPDRILVKVLFEGGPAENRLKVEDVILGANGKTFAAYNWRQGGFKYNISYAGPMMDMGKAIEESEGNPALKGMLSLMIERNGKEETVAIPIEPLGYFSKTYPDNCAKSAKILEKLDTWLEHNKGAAPHSQNHVGANRGSTALMMLALNEAGKYDDRIRACAHKLIKDLVPANAKTIIAKDEYPAATTSAWHAGFAGIFLAEYYLATHDPKAKDALVWLNYMAWKRQHPSNFDWSHSLGNYPDYRTNKQPKGPGYPRMTAPSGLIFTSWALADRAGVESSGQRLFDLLERARGGAVQRVDDGLRDLVERHESG